MVLPVREKTGLSTCVAGFTGQTHLHIGLVGRFEVAAHFNLLYLARLAFRVRFIVITVSLDELVNVSLQLLSQVIVLDLKFSFHFHLFLGLAFVRFNRLGLERFVEGFLVEVIDVIVSSLLQTFHELLLDGILDLGGDECFLFASLLTSLDVRSEWDEKFLPAQLQFPHADQVLSDFHESLLALESNEAVPVQEVFVDLLDGLVEVAAEFSLLPSLVREGEALCCLHVQVDHAIFLSDGRVLTVGQRARLPAAQSRQIVFISAEILCFRCGTVEIKI